jgi:membrane protein implicated in regulation of membrane protease activity
MHLDIRIPIGWSFIALGVLLAGFGLLTMFGVFGGAAMYAEHSLGINVNLWWGLVMLAFGAMMLWLGRRGTSSVHSADESPEGRKLEEVEAAREREDRPRGH